MRGIVKRIVVIGALVCALTFVVIVFAYPSRPTVNSIAVPIGAFSVKGKVISVSQDAKTLSLNASNGNTVSVVYTNATKILNNEGRIVDFTALQPDMNVTAIGSAPNSFLLNATSILISEDSQEAWGVQPDTLFDNSLIPTAYSISGLAKREWFGDKGYFYVEVLDGKGDVQTRSKVYPQSHATTTDLLSFTAWLSFSAPKTATGTVVFLPADQNSTSDAPISIRVRFAVQAGTIAVKLYYPNSRKADALGNTCDVSSILPAVHNIPNTKSPISDSIAYLISGVIDEEEKLQGFTTAFPIHDLTLLRSTLASTGVLTLEFTEPTNFNSNGDTTCQIGLISAQIKKTAEQFSSVKKVVLLPTDFFGPQ